MNATLRAMPLLEKVFLNGPATNPKGKNQGRCIAGGPKRLVPAMFFGRRCMSGQSLIHTICNCTAIWKVGRERKKREDEERWKGGGGEGGETK